MKRAIYINFILPILLAILLLGVFCAYTVSSSLERGTRREMTNLLSILVPRMDITVDAQATAEELSQRCYGYRITIVGADGTVLADTQQDPMQMGNHARREEIVQAQQQGVAYAKRYSQTQRTEMLYVALRAQNGNVVRCAVPLTTFFSQLFTQYPYFLAGIVLALLLALLVTLRLSKSLVSPIEQIASGIRHIDEKDYHYAIPAQKYREMDDLATLINTLSKNVSRSVQETEEERQKLAYLLDSIRQGVVVVDSRLDIVQFNRAAMQILNRGGNLTRQSLYHLTRQVQILTAVQNCVANKSSAIFDIEMEETGQVFSVSVTAVDSKWVKNGALIVMTDVTDSRKAEQMRREFVANASHELKTPITSIKGFAELLSSKMVRDPQQVDDYLERIRKEADRMTYLISDILKLSSIEEGEVARQIEPVDLLELAQEVKHELLPLAFRRHVSIDVIGEPVVMEAGRDDLRRLLMNLVVNAVKYNVENGKVQIEVFLREGGPAFTVSDTGIGIPEKDKTRVFERFYTVDKGRSASVGGTGLGLSIVKHIVAAYEGEIQIVSELGKGTSITVSFPLSG